jgi:hypothetical protein
MGEVGDISGIIRKNETEFDDNSILRTPMTNKSMYKFQQ